MQVPTIPEGGAGLLERDGDQARGAHRDGRHGDQQEHEDPQPRQYRLQVTLVEEDGEWLTSGLEFIDAQS